MKQGYLLKKKIVNVLWLTSLMYIIYTENKLSELAFQFINKPWMNLVRSKTFIKIWLHEIVQNIAYVLPIHCDKVYDIFWL